MAGLPSTVLRNAVWNGVYFASIHVLSADGGGPGQRLVVGLAAGIFATCFNAPFDVAKSRIQSESKAKRSTFGILWEVLRHEGATERLVVLEILRREGAL